MQVNLFLILKIVFFRTEKMCVNITCTCTNSFLSFFVSFFSPRSPNNHVIWPCHPDLIFFISSSWFFWGKGCIHSPRRAQTSSHDRLESVWSNSARDHSGPASPAPAVPFWSVGPTPSSASDAGQRCDPPTILTQPHYVSTPRKNEFRTLPTSAWPFSSNKRQILVGHPKLIHQTVGCIPTLPHLSLAPPRAASPRLSAWTPFGSGPWPVCPGQRYGWGGCIVIHLETKINLSLGKIHRLSLKFYFIFFDCLPVSSVWTLHRTRIWTLTMLKISPDLFWAAFGFLHVSSFFLKAWQQIVCGLAFSIKSFDCLHFVSPPEDILFLLDFSPLKTGGTSLGRKPLVLLPKTYSRFLGSEFFVKLPFDF